MTLLRKFFHTQREQGWSRSIYKATVFSLRKCGVKIPHEQVGVLERRKQLSQEISQKLQFSVAYGPFKGLQFGGEGWWDGQDRAAILLGLYEKEILDILDATRSKYTTLINVGAADGYYAIGVLVAGLVEKSYCYEISTEGQEAIARNAKKNGVYDNVTIIGAATSEFYQQIPAQEREKAIVLIDIEGAEFEVLTADAFKSFTQSIFIVEIHDWIEEAEFKIKRLKESIPSNYVLSIVKTGARDLSEFEELKSYNDTDRWLICSEGRPSLMSWYIIEEK